MAAHVRYLLEAGPIERRIRAEVSLGQRGLGAIRAKLEDIGRLLVLMEAQAMGGVGRGDDPLDVHLAANVHHTWHNVEIPLVAAHSPSQSKTIVRVPLSEKSSAARGRLMLWPRSQLPEKTVLWA